MNCNGIDFDGNPCGKKGNCEKEKKMKSYGFVDPGLCRYFAEHDFCWG